MAKQEKLLLFALFGFTLISFIIGGQIGLDPDFGWHLRIGQLIAEKGIPTTDPFSYTMPSYPYVDHEWLTNLAMAKVYPVVGLSGLAFFYSVLAASAIGLMMLIFRTKWQIIPVLLAASALLPFLGIRPQIISWLFTAILLLLILKDTLWKKLRFFLPILFVLWGNLHGGFPLGLSLLFLFVFIQSLRQMKWLWIDILICLLCFIATFINPYGIGVWWEIWMTMTDSALRWKIVEWGPTFSSPIYGFILLFPLSLLLVLRYRRKFILVELVVYFWLLVFGISSSRHVPFWLLISIPMTARVFSYFFMEVSKHPLSKQRFSIVYTCLLIFTSVIVTANVGFNTLRLSSGHTDSYPQGAVTFVSAHPSSGNIFAEYGWGGYLLWKLPEKKVFIDGRMPSWRNDDASAEESKYAFNDHLAIMRGEKETEQLINKYDVDTIVLSNEDNTKLVEVFELYLPFSLPIPKRLRLQEKLLDLKFKEVYRDDVSSVYRRELKR